MGAFYVLPCIVFYIRLFYSWHSGSAHANRRHNADHGCSSNYHRIADHGYGSNYHRIADHDYDSYVKTRANDNGDANDSTYHLASNNSTRHIDLYFKHKL